MVTAIPVVASCALRQSALGEKPGRLLSAALGFIRAVASGPQFSLPVHSKNIYLQPKNFLLMIPQQPRFENFPGKKLVGMRTRLSLSNNTTKELWQNFMPRRKEIVKAIGNDVFSVQLYDASYFKMFNPAAGFEKWAAVEVSDQNVMPAGMEALSVPAGLYAVFIYKGGAAEAAPFFSWVFRDWLPTSGYVLDDRPHFEILGEKYKRDSADSEEEVWVPVRKG